MTPRGLALSAAAIVAIASGNCAPALRTPPSSVSEISRSASPATVDEAPRSAAIDRARAAWERRPDVEAVREAERAYLEAAEANPDSAEPIVGAVRAKAWLVEREPDRDKRETLATSMVQTAQLCALRAPGDPSCDYWLGIALGVQAREKPATAPAGVNEMTAALGRAFLADPSLDQAGPSRVLALVYLRAPGWPLGPGDPEAALAQARKAVEAFPEFPPNLLALGEALEGNGRRDEAREAYEKARAAAEREAAGGSPDAPDWARAAERALAR